MATINSIAQARAAKAGTHGVKGKTAPAGISLKKESDALGAGGFNLRFRRGNRRPTMGLGPVNEFKNLDEVFEAARDALKLVKQGHRSDRGAQAREGRPTSPRSASSRRPRPITRTSRRR